MSYLDSESLLEEPIDALTVRVAKKILRDFCFPDGQLVQSQANLEAKSEAEKELVRQALLFLVNLSDHQNIGICADHHKEGLIALADYLKALGYSVPFDLANADLVSSDRGVYIKFSTQRMAYYLEPYLGSERGVLVSCQSFIDDEVSGTYGHLPLNLFAASLPSQ